MFMAFGNTFSNALSTPNMVEICGKLYVKFWHLKYISVTCLHFLATIKVRKLCLMATKKWLMDEI